MQDARPLSSHLAVEGFLELGNNKSVIQALDEACLLPSKKRLRLRHQCYCSRPSRVLAILMRSFSRLLVVMAWISSRFSLRSCSIDSRTKAWRSSRLFFKDGVLVEWEAALTEVSYSRLRGLPRHSPNSSKMA
jgi:hypothetical protein